MDGQARNEAAIAPPDPTLEAPRPPAPEVPDLGGESPSPLGDIGRLRGQLNTETDGEYRRMLLSLTPRYAPVWRDILLGYAALAVFLAIADLPVPGPFSAALVLLGAIGVGYAAAFLQLFIHEAAHANLWPDRRVNDRLANIFIAWHLGADTARYRMTHLVHHRNHGLTSDSEHSYFNALTPGFLLATLTGAHAVRVFLGRASGAERGRDRAGGLWPLARGVLVHLCLIAGLVACGAWRSALAWVIGVGAFLPFFIALRQLLEHRAPNADPSVDYARTPHGAYTRVFRGGLFAKTFGGAGFDRHLLHHWEPQISYTRLAELEAYLRRTSARAIIEDHTTTYGQTLRRLWRGDQQRRDGR